MPDHNLPRILPHNLPHILIVDDERSIREPLSEYLEGHGFRVKDAASADAARTLLAANNFDLVICDIMMPGEDGLALTRHIRERGDLPVILLTARTEDTERIVGLEMGADDYLGKPFNPRELVARIKAVLRRTALAGERVNGDDGESFAFGDWVLKTTERALVGKDGVTVPLSTGEYQLLLALVRHPNQVLSRDRLLDMTQGREAEAFDRAIDNQVSRLRRKIEPDPKNPTLVRTVWGGGYTLASDVKRIMD